MAVAIRLPDMGTNVQECKVLGWRVKPGEVVKRGDVVADIETDKAVAELESTGEGVLLEVIVKAGDLARTGDVLAYVGRPGESVAGEARAAAASTAAPAPAAASTVAPSSPRGGGQFPRVAPVVRNLAAKLGVDLGRVRGTGAGGVITREDVLRAGHEQAASEPETTLPREPSPRAGGSGQG